jgi:hypothetical protein
MITIHERGMDTMIGGCLSIRGDRTHLLDVASVKGNKEQV